MISNLFFFLTLFFSLALAAQSAPASANEAAVYSLSGMVQNSVTGEPIPRALVQIGTGASTFSDGGGRFEFDKVNAGVMIITARKPGFLSPEEVEGEDRVSVTFSGRSVSHSEGPTPTLEIGPGAPPVTLKLIPEGVVFGRAQKTDGEPIGSLTVQLFYVQISQGRRKVLPMNSAQTDEEGEFRIAGLRPGTYYLQAGPRFMPTWTGAPGQRAHEAAYRPVFYPGVPDLSSAAPLQVSAGQQLEADLALNPNPVFRVSGTLVGMPPNDPAGDLFPRVSLLPRDNRSVAMPVQAESGNEFQAKVPEGSYIVRADIDTPQGPYGGDLPVTVQSDMSGLNLMVAPAPELHVEVSVQRTHANPNPLTRTLDQVNVHFISQDLKGPTLENAFADARVRGLEPGVYAVEVNAMDASLYVDSAQCGGVDLLRDNLMVGVGTPPIRVSLRDDGGTVAGNIISDGQAAPGTVLIIPDRAPKLVKAAVAGANGQFQSPKLAPGDYTVVAFERVAGFEYTNPEVISPYLGNAIHVSVVANGESRVTVNLIQTSK
jgi:hypothetical protein